MGFGKGKTLVLTALAYYWTVLKGGNKFLSNMPLNFKELQPFITVEPLIETGQFDDENNDTMVILDEGQRYFDRREHGKPETKFVMQWAVDLRKSDMQIISTIQYLDWLENRATNFLQMAIVPEFVNHYSLNEAEEIAQRLLNKDFLSHWKIVDYKTDREFDLIINMYPFINMYDTRYKAKKLVTSHKEFLDYKREKESGKKFDERLLTNAEETKTNRRYWKSFEKKLACIVDVNANGSISDELAEIEEPVEEFSIIKELKEKGLITQQQIDKAKECYE